MKTLVLFYSFSGKTKAIASSKAQELDADVVEVKEVKHRNAFQAYTVGCYQAMKQKKPGIQPLGADLGAYEKIVVAMPIWAGSPAPAFNSVVGLLPPGQQLALIMVSGSGNSNREKAVEYVKAHGCEVLEYFDIKA